MRFLKPDVLWHLLWLMPLMIVVFVISGRRTAAVLKSFLGKHAEDPEYVQVSGGKRLLRFVILLTAVVFLVCAAARPSWGVQIQEMHGQGRDLLFVFDTSKSMLAKDVQPSRLAHAKWLVRELVKRNPGDRFGLIAFAGRAFLECPLTSDKTSFLQAVDELSTSSIPVGGTNIQAALETALQAFKAAETQHRAVVLITDGDELEGDSGKAVDEIIARKIPLFIAGIGDPAQPSIIQIPDGHGGFKTLKDNQGNIVNSPLNEASLGSLAKRTGGIYVRSTSGDPRLNALEKRIRALAPQDYESVKTTKPIDRFSYPLGIAFLLMLIWFALSERAVRNSSAAAAILLCMVAALPVHAESAPANGTIQADRALPAQLPESTGAQTEPSGGEQNAEQVTNDPVKLFNRGVDAQEQGKLPEAVKQYENALANGVDNIEIRGKVSQNLGVITHTKARAELGGSLQALQQQNLDEAQKKVDASLKVMEQAEEMYRESMRETEDHSAIAKNQSILLADRRKAETLKKKIEELKKMQQQAQKQTQLAKNQQQKENQQKQDQNQQGQDQQKQDQNQQKENQQKQDQNQQGQDQQKQDQSQQGQNQQKQDQSQQGQDQQKQDQSQQGQNQQKQDQSQQGQDQQKQEQSQSDQQSAQQKTEEARQSAEDLQKKARELGQKKMEQSAEQAKQELDKAREEQRKGNGKSAEEHLNKALEKLGGDPDRKQDPSKQDSKDGKDQKENQEKNDRKQEDSGKQEKPDSQEPQSAQGQPQKEPEEGEIDKSQAAAILEDMAKDEKNLRDAIKAHQKQRYRNAVPAKDW